MENLKFLLEKVDNNLVIQIMEENGSKLYNRTIDGKTKQELLWFKTICHGGDSHKLCYFTQSKDFYCYTNCGRMNFFQFLKRIRDCKSGEFYVKVVKYLNDKLGIKGNQNRFEIETNTKESRSELFHLDEICERKKKLFYFNNDNKINKFYDGRILEYFDPNTFYQGWIDEGISCETMKKFNIRWYEFQKYIIIPHYDINGKLIGIRRRSLNPEDTKRKYMPLIIEEKSYDHPLTLNLYGLYQNKNQIKKEKTAIIVEAEKSVLLSDSFFGDKSITVATCGFNISDQQLNLLLSLGVENIYLGFDKDFDEKKIDIYSKDEKKYREFLRYKEKINNLAEKVNNYCNVFILKDTKGLLNIKDSPFDKGKKVFNEILKDKKLFYM